MSVTAKAFFSLFLLLAAAALGHDIYVWYNSNGEPFAFAALGWISKTYLPAEHQLLVDMIGGPESFNSVVTPILRLPAFFLAAGLAVLVYLIDFINRTIKKMNPGRGKDRDQKLKRYQR
jgi:hypothetical protein